MRSSPSALVGFLLAPALLAGQASLRRNIDTLIQRTPVLKSSFLGLRIVKLSNGKVLYERNSASLFVPASNTKLFTTALALTRLGPDYRFHTSVIAENAIDAMGHLEGDLILVGRGDPSLSGRTYPYDPDAPAANPLQAVEDLATQIVAKGVHSIT